MWRPNALYYLGYGMPFNAVSDMASDVQFCAANKLVGGDFDTMLGDHATVGASYYVLGRLLSEPGLALPQLLTEYYSGYGAAASAVAAYWRFWRFWFRHASLLWE